MSHSTPRHSHGPTDHDAHGFDNCTHYNRDRAERPHPQGRLVLVLEHDLSDASRDVLHNLLEKLIQRDEVTMVSGLTRASMLQAEALSDGLFYNRREYLSPEKAFRLLPWREIWVIAGGLVWSLSPASS